MAGAISCPLIFSERIVAPPTSYIDSVETPQLPDHHGLDSLTLPQVLQHYRVPALSVAVIRDFRIHWAKAYGVADRVSAVAAETDTLFQAASISKPVAAMLVMKAIQDDYFGLYDDVFSVLKSWCPAETTFTRTGKVTPLSLMSHTSGLGDGYGYPGYPPGSALPSLLQILNGEAPCNVGATRFHRSPMSAWQYSGAGYTILQLLLEEVYRQPFATLLHQQVLSPLNMTRSGFDDSVAQQQEQNRARGHDMAGQSMPHKWHRYPEQAAAGLWTTASDLAQFMIELQRSLHGQSNLVLSRNTIQAMATPVGVGDYAAGFAIEKQGDGWYLTHHGDNVGFKGWICGHKQKGYGCVLLCNGDNGVGVIREVTSRIQRVYEWDLPRPRE
ncbi:serine hydrolase domain-containing protein [Ketobacter sp.]